MPPTAGDLDRVRDDAERPAVDVARHGERRRRAGLLHRTTELARAVVPPTVDVAHVAGVVDCGQGARAQRRHRHRSGPPHREPHHGELVGAADGGDRVSDLLGVVAPPAEWLRAVERARMVRAHHDLDDLRRGVGGRRHRRRIEDADRAPRVLVGEPELTVLVRPLVAPTIERPAAHDARGRFRVAEVDGVCHGRGGRRGVRRRVGDHRIGERVGSRVDPSVGRVLRRVGRRAIHPRVHPRAIEVDGREARDRGARHACNDGP